MSMKRRFQFSYDKVGDVLTVYSPNAAVRESIEVTDDLILDVDKDMRVINLELLDAYKFLHTLNSSISKKTLQHAESIWLEAKRYRNYWVITLTLKHDDGTISEKLPAFASSDFRSPLLAS